MQSTATSMSVWLSVRITRNHTAELHQFLCMLPLAVAQSYFDRVVIVLCTSGFVDDRTRQA